MRVSGGTVLTDKERLRRDARRRRRDFVEGLTPADRETLEAALADSLEPWLSAARIVGSYAPMGHEVDPAVCERRSEQAWIALPWFEARGTAMHYRRAGGPLVSGPYGTLQPLADAELVHPDLLLVPLVAADPHGNRIGQGQGHFDRALAAFRGERSVRAVGLAWDVQIAEHLPADPWDERLDLVATPTRLYGQAP